MRRCAFLAALFVASFLGGLGAADIKSGPQPGTKDKPASLPGSFEILSVTPEKNAGRFHCPVSDFGLNPAVLIFTQVEPDSVSPEIVTLLKNLEATVAKYPEVQLGACVVFLNDGGYREALENKSDDLPKAIEFKDQRQQKIKDFAKTQGRPLDCQISDQQGCGLDHCGLQPASGHSQFRLRQGGKATRRAHHGGDQQALAAEKMSNAKPGRTVSGANVRSRQRLYFVGWVPAETAWQSVLQ